MFDLAKLPAHFVATYGIDKVAEVVSAKPSIVAMWNSRKKFPLEAVAKLLEFDPAPLGDVTPLYTSPEVGTKLVILVPLSGPPQPKMMDCLLKLYDRHEMGYERFAFNNLSVSRNVLAARFLAGPYQWAWWMDADNIMPCGDAAWYQSASGVQDMPALFAGAHSIYRALVHRKTIMSVCYVARHQGGSPQFGGGNLKEMVARVKRGPRNEVIEVPWAGMGGMLTHRSVFEDIIKTQGDELRMKPDGISTRFKYTYAFFNPIDLEHCGDDIPFCIRAAKAGHKTHVDLALHSAHIGDRAWTYQDL